MPLRGVISEGTVVDSQDNVYFADSSNNRIRKVNTRGVITTVAGNGISGFSGDGGLATEANLHFPEGVALDSMGNIYFSDYGNDRIRKIECTDTPSPRIKLPKIKLPIFKVPPWFQKPRQMNQESQ